MELFDGRHSVQSQALYSIGIGKTLTGRHPGSIKKEKWFKLDFRLVDKVR